MEKYTQYQILSRLLDQIFNNSVCAAYFCYDFNEFGVLRQYHGRCFILSIASSSSSLDTLHLSLICSVWLHALCFLHDVCRPHRRWKDLISLSSSSSSSLSLLPSLLFFVYGLSLLLFRGGAVSDGWGAQTDPDPAWRDGEHVVVVVVMMLKSAHLKPPVWSQTDCGPVVLESPH